MEALAAKADAKQQDDLANQVANALESGAPQSTSGDKCRDSIANFFNMNVPWRARVMTLALIVGLMCGVVACMYDLHFGYAPGPSTRLPRMDETSAHTG